MAKATISVFSTDAELGIAAAQEIIQGIQDAEVMGRKYVLGCPGGRSPRSTYLALAALLSKAGQSIKHLHIAMMDEYVVQLPNGDFRNVDERSHFSCRRFAFHEIRNVLNAGLEEDLQLPFEQVHVPDAEKPEEYENLVRTLGVDCFLLASGASDGHVAFNGRGTPRAATTRITPLSEETRRDNMHTFPEFKSLAEVPIFGVSAIVEHREDLQGFNRKAILKKAASGEVLVLDVRPADEFAAAHLPHARSLPLDELKKRLAELPKDTPVVAYCRGPFCLMARDAVALLHKKGYRAFHLTDGVAEWRAHGLPIEA